MQFDFNLPMQNLAGETIKDDKGNDLTIGKVLSNTLASQTKGNAVKYFGWAQDLYNCKPLNLDKADKKELSDFIENSDQLTVLSKGQLLNIFENTKE